MAETNPLFPEIEAEKQALLDPQQLRVELDELRSHIFEAKTNHWPRYAFVLAAGSLLGVSLLWLNTRHTIAETQKNLSIKLADYSTINSANTVLIKDANERTLSANSRISLLEQQLAASKNQQETLQTLYNALANTHEERAIAEVEQLLLIANQQIQLEGNVRPAILALQAADNQLQPFNNSQVAQIRLAITQDISRLQATPLVDILGLNAQLENLIISTDKLKTVSERTQPNLIMDKETDVKPRQFWQRLSTEMWADIKDMVKVERIDRAEPPLLSPDQQFFLAQNLKLRLLTARVALLQHDDASFKKDLKAASMLIKQYFDPMEANAKTMQAQLQALTKEGLSIATPDISRSLKQVAQYKLSLENADAH